MLIWILSHGKKYSDNYCKMLDLTTVSRIISNPNIQKLHVGWSKREIFLPQRHIKNGTNYFIWTLSLDPNFLKLWGFGQQICNLFFDKTPTPLISVAEMIFDAQFLILLIKTKYLIVPKLCSSTHVTRTKVAVNIVD